MREIARTHHKQVLGVPVLQVGVHHAVFRALARDGAARVVRGLVRYDIVILGAGLGHHGLRIHGLGHLFDFLGDVIEKRAVLIGKVVGHAQKRQPVGILVGFIQGKIVGLVGDGRALCPDAQRTVEVVRGGLLELRTPCARARRGGVALNGAFAGLRQRNDAAVDELEIGVIEVVGVEVVITHAERASPGKEVHGFFKEERRAGRNLIAVAPAQRALPRFRIILLADLGNHEQLGVVHHIA